jgi:hypothetical protein
VAQHRNTPADLLDSLRHDASSVVRDAAEARLSKPS